jgi:putative transposase
MPRHPRVHAPGLLYHVMARGNNGRKVFASDKDYEAFLDQLLVVRGRQSFYLYASPVMEELGTPKRYEAFIRDGGSVPWRS